MYKYVHIYIYTYVCRPIWWFISLSVLFLPGWQAQSLRFGLTVTTLTGDAGRYITAAAAESSMPGHQDRLLPGLRERPRVAISGPHLAVKRYMRYVWYIYICVCVCRVCLLHTYCHNCCQLSVMRATDSASLAGKDWHPAIHTVILFNAPQPKIALSHLARPEWVWRLLIYLSLWLL